MTDRICMFRDDLHSMRAGAGGSALVLAGACSNIKPSSLLYFRDRPGHMHVKCRFLPRGLIPPGGAMMAMMPDAADAETG